MLQDRKKVVISIICLIALCVVITPLLILGFYSYPIADDWSLGVNVYRCIKEGGNIFQIISEASRTVVLWQANEPRFTAVFLGSLQPGVWGEQFYWITTWLMIGSIIISEFFLAAFLLKDRNGRSMVKIIPIVTPSIIIQLMCVQFPVESFYWWTGAVNYTFIFSISLILFVIFWSLTKAQKSVMTAVARVVGGGLLAVLVGGNNYATSLSMVCLFVSLSVILLLKDRKVFWRTLPVTLTIAVCLAVCLMAPGNQTRLEEEFDGTTMGAVNAVFMSLFQTASNIFSWTSWKIVFMLLLIAPFLWYALQEAEYSFKYPALFTAYTFGIYASQIVATMYVGGNTGGGRMAAILYYAYHIWIVLNFGYWMGWVQRKKLVWMPAVLRLFHSIKGGVLSWFCILGIITAVSVGFEIKTTSLYRACAWLLTGTAKEFADAWEERLEILHNENIKEVYFDPLPGYNGEMIFYADFQKGENWVNSACAHYYEKDYVGLAQ